MGLLDFVTILHGEDHETDISAQQDKEEEDPRVPGPLPDQERTRSATPQTGQGTQTIGSVSFRRSRRLTKRPQFLSCYRWGRRYFSPSFLAYVLPHEIGGQGWRLGTAVSKKIGSAPQRNRVKRLIREVFRLHQQDFDLDADVVVIPKRGIDPGALTFDQVDKELTGLMHRAEQGLSRYSDTKKPSNTPA